MATLHDYFVAEASEHLDRFEEALAGSDADLAQLHGAARALRGTAQIAREDSALRGARVLETATRALREGRLQLDAATRDRLRASAEDLRAIARGASGGERADAIVARWAEAGIERASQPIAGAGAQTAREFLEFAAREVAGIAAELDRSLRTLADAPMDREPIRAVLRRQRALLGATRLDDIPVLAEALRAVEDLSSVIVKLDVGVRHEWLDVFRCARDVLHSAAPLLQTGRQPESTNALSRLRVLRQELLERHGSAEAVSTATGTPAAAPDEAAPPPQPESAARAPQPPAPAQSMPATPARPAPVVAASAPGDDIDVRELQYRGESALQRAAELRPVLERMLADTPGGREALAELYDLLKLARE